MTNADRPSPLRQTRLTTSLPTGPAKTAATAGAAVPAPAAEAIDILELSPPLLVELQRMEAAGSPGLELPPVAWCYWFAQSI
jgi:hypothetical protein